MKEIFETLRNITLCKLQNITNASNYGALYIIEFQNILKSCEVLRSKITEYYEL